MNELLSQIKNLTVLEMSMMFLISNIIIFLSSVLFCWLLARLFSQKRIFDTWEPLRKIEVSAALLAIILNAGVGVAGWFLWRAEFISVSVNGIWVNVFDCLLMITAMDFGMYCSHRLAHHPWIFDLVHRFHHRHVATNPISLFVLHPFEVLGFGGLMIGFLMIYQMSLVGLLLYLFFNVIFGTIGHCGVEPFPKSVAKNPILSLIGSSTFHAGHHQSLDHNFGFYTLVWDKLFKTLKV